MVENVCKERKYWKLFRPPCKPWCKSIGADTLSAAVSSMAPWVVHYFGSDSEISTLAMSFSLDIYYTQRMASRDSGDPVTSPIGLS